MKKLLCVLLALVLAAAMPIGASAYWDDWASWEEWYAWAHGHAYDGAPDWWSNRNNVGIWGFGGFSHSTPAFRLGAESESEIAFDGILERDADWTHVIPGSTLYIPLAIENADGTLAIATDRQVRDHRVTISYMVAQGSRYVQSVELIDTRRERITGLAAGMHVRIVYSEQTQNLSPVNVIVNVALNVNRIYQTDTEIEVGVNLVNHDVIIDRTSVFGARVPTAFQAAHNFSGEATFDMGGGVRYTGRVSASERYLIAYTSTPIADIVDANPDAHLAFHRFLGGQATFAGTGQLQIPINLSNFVDANGNPQVFVYEIQRGSYNLVAISNGISLDRRAGILTLQTNRLTEWVISNQSLQRTAAHDDGGILQAGFAGEDAQGVISAAMQEVPAAAPVETAINVQNMGATHNPPTGMRTGALPLESAAAIAAASFIVAAWIAVKKVREMLAKKA